MASQDGSQGQTRKSPSPGATTQPSDRRSSIEGHTAAAAGKRDASYKSSSEAPLPYDDSAPPLPDEPAPDAKNNGWEPRWDATSQAYYYFNRFTGISQWHCPHELEAATYPHTAYDTHLAYDRTYTGGVTSGYPMTSSTGAAEATSRPPRKWGGYNPAIHGSYDPNADYAKAALEEEEEEEKAAAGSSYGAAHDYSATAQFNRFTGKFQQAGQGPELHNDDNKSKRQMNAFFDVNAAANDHGGRSLKAERRAKPLTKQQIQDFKEKRKQKKEKKRLEWLRS